MILLFSAVASGAFLFAVVGICALLAYSALQGTNIIKESVKQDAEKGVVLKEIKSALAVMYKMPKVMTSLIDETIGIFNQTVGETMIVHDYGGRHQFFDFIQLMESIENYFDSVILQNKRITGTTESQMIYNLKKGDKILTLGLSIYWKDIDKLVTYEEDNLMYLKGEELGIVPEEGAKPGLLITNKLLFIATTENSEVKQNVLKGIVSNAKIELKAIERSRKGSVNILTKDWDDQYEFQLLPMDKLKIIPKEVGVSVTFNEQSALLPANSAADIATKIILSKLRPNLLILGQTVGAGKTSLLNSIMSGLALKGAFVLKMPPSMITKALVDPSFYPELKRLGDIPKILCVDEADFIYGDGEFMSTLKPFLSGTEGDLYNVSFMFITEKKFEELPIAFQRTGRGNFRMDCQFVEGEKVRPLSQELAKGLAGFTVSDDAVHNILEETEYSPKGKATLAEVTSTIRQDFNGILEELAKELLLSANIKPKEKEDIEEGIEEDNKEVILKEKTIPFKKKPLSKIRRNFQI